MNAAAAMLLSGRKVVAACGYVRHECEVAPCGRARAWGQCCEAMRCSAIKLRYDTIAMKCDAVARAWGEKGTGQMSMEWEGV